MSNNKIPLQLTGLNLTSDQIDTIMSLVSIAENSSTSWWEQYDYCEDIKDGRGYTAGFYGFCSGTGDMLEVFKELSNINPSHALVKYLPALIKVNNTQSHNGLDGLVDACKKYCDNDYKLAQWRICYKLYWKPVIDYANNNKLVNAITIGELYDTIINFGNLKDITTRVKSSTGDEVKWLNEFLNIKQDWITNKDYSLNSGQPDRCILWRSILDSNNLSLTRPINNLVCYGDKFNLPTLKPNPTPIPSPAPGPSKTEEIYFLVRIIYGQNPRTSVSNIQKYLKNKFSDAEIKKIYININAHIKYLNKNINTNIQPFFDDVKEDIVVHWTSLIEQIMSFSILLYNLISDKISYDDSTKLWKYFLGKYNNDLINKANNILNDYIKDLIDNNKSYYSNSALLELKEQPKSLNKNWGTVTFEDKFKDLKNWNVRDNFNKTRFAKNVVVDSTGLHLITKKNTEYPEKKWSSGYIFSKNKFGYGYFECKMRYAKAKGVNNAFWMTSDTYTWNDRKRLDEIDINEGHSLNVLTMTLHQWLDGYSINKDTTKSINTYNTDLSLDYHTYGFNYTPKVLEWYLDGALVKSIDNTDPKVQIIDQKLKIIFSTAIIQEAGVIGDVENTSMDVEYVRYYKN